MLDGNVNSDYTTHIGS